MLTGAELLRRDSEQLSRDTSTGATAKMVIMTTMIDMSTTGTMISTVSMVNMVNTVDTGTTGPRSSSRPSRRRGYFFRYQTMTVSERKSEAFPIIDAVPNNLSLLTSYSYHKVTCLTILEARSC